MAWLTRDPLDAVDDGVVVGAMSSLVNRAG
jgi:hypothetical protein